MILEVIFIKRTKQL